MTYREILEACWTGYRQAGMKNKGGRQVPNCVPVREAEIEENLRDWFKEKWVRFGPDGKIRGDCARGVRIRRQAQVFAPGQGTCTGQKRSCVSAAARKRRQDPNPNRTGKAINVATKKK
jgi:hypothetical protein